MVCHRVWGGSHGVGGVAMLIVVHIVFYTHADCCTHSILHTCTLITHILITYACTQVVGHLALQLYVLIPKAEAYYYWTKSRPPYAPIAALLVLFACAFVYLCTFVLACVCLCVCILAYVCMAYHTPPNTTTTPPPFLDTCHANNVWTRWSTTLYTKRSTTLYGDEYP